MLTKIQTIEVKVDKGSLQGDLLLPPSCQSIVLFAHGSGSSRHSPRNKFVADALNEAGFGTLLLDLLTEKEESYNYQIRFDIELLAHRLIAAIRWLKQNSLTKKLEIGLFGASTGSAAALIAAAQKPDLINAVVSRGGRVDLAHDYLRFVKAPTLLIVGELDQAIIELNQKAWQKILCQKELKVVPGATHLFEEAGALEEVAGLATDWFKQYCPCL